MALIAIYICNKSDCFELVICFVVCVLVLEVFDEGVFDT